MEGGEGGHDFLLSTKLVVVTFFDINQRGVLISGVSWWICSISGMPCSVLKIEGVPITGVAFTRGPSVSIANSV